MKPHLVGSACHRVQQTLDEALGEGVLSLPPELRSHAARCARCGPEVADTEALLARLRGAAAVIPMGQVPRVVDQVVERTLAGPGAGVGRGGVDVAQGGTGVGAGRGVAPKRPPDLRWLLGQLTVVATVMIVALGGTTYTVLKLHQVLRGPSPSQVAERLAAPFREMVSAVFRSAR
jgi:hypothetical protein